MDPELKKKLLDHIYELDGGYYNDGCGCCCNNDLDEDDDFIAIKKIVEEL